MQDIYKVFETYEQLHKVFIYGGIEYLSSLNSLLSAYFHYIVPLIKLIKEKFCNFKDKDKSSPKAYKTSSGFN